MSSDFKKKSKKTKEEDEKEQLEKLQSDNDYAESLRSEGANDQEGEDKKWRRKGMGGLTEHRKTTPTSLELK